MAIIFLLLPLAIFASPCSKVNDTQDMCSGQFFFTEEASDKCVKELRLCAGEAKASCRSRTVVAVECVQQYGGVWMTKCICK